MLLDDLQGMQLKWKTIYGIYEAIYCVEAAEEEQEYADSKV